MKWMLPGISDELTRVIVRDAAEKLEKVPEPECSRFITVMRASFLGIHKKSVRLRLAEARERVKQPPILGHNLAGPERFQPEMRHMIVFDVLNSDSPAGFKVERYRCFLTAQKYDIVRFSGLTESENPAVISPKNRTCDSQKAGLMTAGKPAPNNYNINKTIDNNMIGAHRPWQIL